MSRVFCDCFVFIYSYLHIYLYCLLTARITKQAIQSCQFTEPVFGLWEETDTEHSKLPIGVNLSVNVLDSLWWRTSDLSWVFPTFCQCMLGWGFIASMSLNGNKLRRWSIYSVVMLLIKCNWFSCYLYTNVLGRQIDHNVDCFCLVLVHSSLKFPISLNS